MKLFVKMMFFCLIVSNSYALDIDDLFDGDREFAVPMVYMSSFDSVDTYAYGAMSVEHYSNGIYRGYAGAGGNNRKRVDGVKQNGLGYGFGGYIVGYSLFPSFVIGLSADVMLGGYGVSSTLNGSDEVIVGLYADARLLVNVNVSSSFRISAGVGTRYFQNIERISLPNEQNFLTVMLQFGSFE